MHTCDDIYDELCKTISLRCRPYSEGTIRYNIYSIYRTVFLLGGLHVQSVDGSALFMIWIVYNDMDRSSKNIDV